VHRFWPTGAAFAQLPPGTVDTLLKPENKDLVAKVQSLVAGPTFDAALAARKPRVALLAP
jgi:hypothetical protein